MTESTDSRRNVIRYESLAAEGPQRARVLHLTNMWPDEERPHYGSFIASQARSLPAAGVAVDVAYVRGYLGPQTYLRASYEFARLGRRRPYDLVHVHYGHTAAAAIGVRRRPLIVSFCGEDLLGAPRDHGLTRKSRIEVAIFRQLARLATTTITKSKEMEEVLPRDLWADNHIIPNGVDLERFAPRPRDEARAELGWDPTEKSILFLGNPDDPRKNVALAEAATELVAAAVPEARLRVTWGIEPSLVPTYMNAADCLVFPSVQEGSPNAVKEAMACALPIVAGAVGDISERLDGVANCAVRPHDPSAFADALVTALRSDSRAPAAREAVESLGIGAVAEQLTGIYAEAIARTRGTAALNGLSGSFGQSP